MLAARLEVTRNGVGEKEGMVMGAWDVFCCTDVVATAADMPIEARREEKKGKKRRKADEDSLKALPKGELDAPPNNEKLF